MKSKYRKRKRTKFITKKILLMRRSTLYIEYSKVVSSIYNNRHYVIDVSFIVVFFIKIYDIINNYDKKIV